jgi:hypothetical protein
MSGRICRTLDTAELPPNPLNDGFAIRHAPTFERRVSNFIIPTSGRPIIVPEELECPHFA